LPGCATIPWSDYVVACRSWRFNATYKSDIEHLAGAKGRLSIKVEMSVRSSGAAARRDGAEAMKELPANSAALDMQMSDGLTPLIYAVISGRGDMVEALLKAGADVDAKARDGSTALMKATLWGHSEIVEMLLRYGADTNVSDTDGWTPLKLAKELDHRQIVALLEATRAQD
jgi:ankyrin repeat protein